MLFLVEKNKGGLKKMSMFKEKRKLIFSIFLISCIFISMSLVSAENNITDNAVKSIDDDFILSDNSFKSFEDLNNEINGDLNKTEIILNEDYVNPLVWFNSSSIGLADHVIFINRTLSIDGQGHEIDASKQSRIFHINADNVVLKNIVFKNSSVRGAVFCNGTNITIINSTFIGNLGESYAAAINFKYDGMVINSTFIDNAKYVFDGFVYRPVYCNESTYDYEINCEDVHTIVSFEKNYNVTIINSTFNDNRGVHPEYQRISVLRPDDRNYSYPSINKTNTSKVIKKSSVNVFAKNKVFNKKLKTKFYSVVLKCNAGKVLKNTGVTLKIKGKLFKAKTNKKGKATFKITKLNKKGKYNAKISFKGSKYYNSAVKYVKIIIK